MGCMSFSAGLYSVKAKRVITVLLGAELVISLTSLLLTAQVNNVLLSLPLPDDVLEAVRSVNNSHSLINNQTASSPLPDRRSGDTFSACLLIMDENHRLDEWLAYHYYVMPLRYVVVAVDPNSRTSPTKVLDKWRDYMTIIEWTDQDFLGTELKILDTDNSYQRTYKHRIRQGAFYQSCTKYLKRQNRTWTSYHDVDEFMTINTDVVKNASLGEAIILKTIHKYSQNHTRSPDEPTFWYQHFQQSPCITIARALYGAAPSTTEEIQRDVPDFVNATQFDTLRWRYRATPRGKGRNGNAKSVIDVSRVALPDIMAKPGNAHRPVPKICPKAWLDYDALPLGIHHYLGSWEVYAFREDARKGVSRTIEAWRERAVLQQGGADDEVRPWITGFVNHVGLEVAKKLLKDAGLPANYTMALNRSLEWSVSQSSFAEKPIPV